MVEYTLSLIHLSH